MIFSFLLFGKIKYSLKIGIKLQCGVKRFAVFAFETFDNGSFTRCQ
jgi:hypothetical protein